MRRIIIFLIVLAFIFHNTFGEDIPEYCDLKNPVDTIRNAGYLKYTITTHSEYEGIPAESQMHIIYDMHVNEFVKIDDDFTPEVRIETGFYIIPCTAADISAKEEVCDYIELIRHEIGLVYFYSVLKKGVWKRHVNQVYPEILTKMEGYLSDYWPDDWAMNGISGVSAYYRKQYMFVYIINQNSGNAVLYRRTADQMIAKTNKEWSKTEIPNTDKRVFTALFYHVITGELIAAVNKKGEQGQNEPRVYHYSPNDTRLFVRQDINLRKLFDCKDPQKESNDIFLIVLLVITMIVLLITIGSICYFIYTQLKRGKSGRLKFKRR